MPTPVAADPVTAPEGVVPESPRPRKRKAPPRSPEAAPVNQAIDEPASDAEREPEMSSPTPGRATVPGDQLTQLTAIFADGPLRSRASFDRDFAGRPVHWTGVVRSAVTFRSDVHFGRVDGVRATIAAGEIDVRGFGNLMIEAVVHFPEDTELAVGEEVSFRGTLLKLDGLTRDIYVADGVVA